MPDIALAQNLRRAALAVDQRDKEGSETSIDGYAHCGISKFLPLEDVLEVTDKAGVAQCVLCQHLGEYDNTYLATVVSRYPKRFAAACLVDPAGPEAVEELRRWQATGRFRGLRILAETLESNQPLCLEAIRLGMNLVVYSPGGITTALPGLRRLLEQRSDGTIVISHLGDPQMEGDQLVSGRQLLELASEPSIYVLLSGLSMFCDYPYAPLQDLVSEVIRSFGPQRILWGSNFPVCGDSEAYVRDLQMVLAGSWNLQDDEIEWITRRTAASIWFEDKSSA